MYGMINNAIQDMIIEEYGDKVWDSIKNSAGLQTDGFVSMESYPDGVTYSLVSETCKATGADASDLLERIGEYWIVHTARAGYGEILELAGTNIVEFMSNINSMHSRLSNIMPGMLIPTFDIEEAASNSMIVRYHSHRKGLEPMVKGLLQGLGKRFGIQCTVTLLEGQASTGTDQKYEVIW